MTEQIVVTLVEGDQGVRHIAMDIHEDMVRSLSKSDVHTHVLALLSLAIGHVTAEAYETGEEAAAAIARCAMVSLKEMSETIEHEKETAQ